MIRRPCWILCLPRSGSSYLCDLLNNTGLFPHFQDDRLVSRPGPIQGGRAFNEWLRIYVDAFDLMRNPPPFCKGVYHQYIDVMVGTPVRERRRPPDEFGYKGIDQEAERFVRDKYWTNFLRAILPGIKFVLLERDAESRAVSLYTARTLRTYHLYTQAEADHYHAMQLVVNHGDLYRVYEEVVHEQEKWRHLLRHNPSISVDYGQLVTEPARVLRAIIDYLDIPADDQVLRFAVRRTEEEPRLIRMSRPEARTMMLNFSLKML